MRFLNKKATAYTESAVYCAVNVDSIVTTPIIVSRAFRKEEHSLIQLTELKEKRKTKYFTPCSVQLVKQVGTHASLSQAKINIKTIIICICNFQQLRKDRGKQQLLILNCNFLV